MIATSLINLVGDSLFQTKINTETAKVRSLAIDFAPLFARGDTEALYAKSLQAVKESGGRLLILDMDGKVQVDTWSEFNGWRLGHQEVVSVLNGAQSDYGFYRQPRPAGTESAQMRALFDFLRGAEAGTWWVGYFAEAIVSGANRLGVVFYSTRVQDVLLSLRVMQDRMLLYFFIAAAAVLVLSLFFSRVITKPIAELTEGIHRMARGDLSGRVRVRGIDEMGRLAETFNQMSEKLEHLDATRNEFVSNASHELKTPLATMKIMLESMLYQDDMPKDLQKEFMTDINKELDRLSLIVTDLLTLVQADAQGYAPARKSVLLREIVEETVHRLSRLAEERNQKLETRLNDPCPLVGDPVKLQQIVYNLVENAIKYTPKEGRIRVTLKMEGKTAVLEVADTGPGIPKKDQPHIFDRFYRVDKARARATGGNGLGLSIVHQAVLMHGGSVTVNSVEGKGSTFRVELPA